MQDRANQLELLLKATVQNIRLPEKSEKSEKSTEPTEKGDDDSSDKENEDPENEEEFEIVEKGKAIKVGKVSSSFF